ncbi:MAG: hypothetical protein ABIH89_09960 [Elusimicrobiota bacterium]
MIKKILTISAIAVAAVSFYFLVGKNNVPVKIWFLVSFGPYLIIAALAMKFNSAVIQSALVPIFLFYGAGSVLNIPWQARYYFAHVSAILMLVLTVYFIIMQVSRLKFIKIMLGVIAGIIIFFGMNYYRRNYIDKDDLKKVPYLENKLLY